MSQNLGLTASCLCFKLSKVTIVNPATVLTAVVAQSCSWWCRVCKKLAVYINYDMTLSLLAGSYVLGR